MDLQYNIFVRLKILPQMAFTYDNQNLIEFKLSTIIEGCWGKTL